MMKIFCSFIIVLGLWNIVTGQSGSDNHHISKINLPSSFLIGENEQAYDGILLQYSRGLVDLCGGTEKTFDIWTRVMADLEEFSKKNDMDLRGLKLWMNMFFNNAGGIDYIVYYPKPNSKNMEFEKLTRLFSAFCKEYRTSFVVGEKCMLNATVSFPFQLK